MPIHKLVKPRLPSAAVGIESNVASVVQLDRARGSLVIRRAASLNFAGGLIKSSLASVVQLDRARGSFVIRRAASLNLPDGLIKASFNEPNIADEAELARAL